MRTSTESRLTHLPIPSRTDLFSGTGKEIGTASNLTIRIGLLMMVFSIKEISLG